MTLISARFNQVVSILRLRANRTIRGASDRVDMFKAFNCELDVVDIHGFREQAPHHIDARAATCFVCPFKAMEHASIFGGGGYVNLLVSLLEWTAVDK
jgi:hypothetical protein